MKDRIFLVVITGLLLLAAPDVTAWADTIYLKNGGAIEGIINKENDDSVELSVGFGTVTIKKGDIKSIAKSTDEERDALKQKWNQESIKLKSQEKELTKEREKRLAEYERSAAEEAAKNKSGPADENVKEVNIANDPYSKSIIVETVLNDNVNAVLVVDTGASLILLSKKKGEELGIELDPKDKNEITELHLAGGRTVNGRTVILKSVKIQDVEEKNVQAAILLEDVKDLGARDGLLGRSFLSRFSMKLDLKNMKMSLEKLK